MQIERSQSAKVEPTLTMNDEEKKIYGVRNPKNYQKISLLGRGGCALVWLAKCMKTGQKCAIKQFPKSQAANLESGYKELKINQILFFSK